MGKSDGHSLPSNGDDMCDLSLNLAGSNQVALEKKDLAKKGKLPKIAEVTGTVYRSTCRIKLEPGFKKPSSSHEPASRLSLGGSKTKIERGRSSGLRFRRGPAARGFAPESSSGHDGSVLIAMGCRNCYMHVMVCDADLRCPKCRRGDGLHDIYRD